VLLMAVKRKQMETMKHEQEIWRETKTVRNIYSALSAHIQHRYTDR